MAELRAALEKVLARELPGFAAERTFVELGVDSLALADLLAELEERLQVRFDRLSLGRLSDMATVGEAAALLVELGGRDVAA
ncbi:MAG: hypothetical protein IPJ65_05180 [Archangiaceae bacterium]|nr:hypothetical protein [Archangiaceae bacterium]